MKSEESKNGDRIMDEPMSELVLTMSAWRRLWTMAREIGSKEEPMIGFFLMMLMTKAKNDAKKDMKDSEEELIKKFKKAME